MTVADDSETDAALKAAMDADDAVADADEAAWRAEREEGIASAAATMTIDQARTVLADERERRDHMSGCNLPVEACGECSQEERMGWGEVHAREYDLDAARRVLRAADAALVEADLVTDHERPGVDWAQERDDPDRHDALADADPALRVHAGEAGPLGAGVSESGADEENPFGDDSKSWREGPYTDAEYESMLHDPDRRSFVDDRGKVWTQADAGGGYHPDDSAAAAALGARSAFLGSVDDGRRVAALRDEFTAARAVAVSRLGSEDGATTERYGAGLVDEAPGGGQEWGIDRGDSASDAGLHS